jgi:hypothetical protein
MNIRTLGEFKKESKPFKSAFYGNPKRMKEAAPKRQDNKKTESYTGGEKSGLAVENPNDINSIVSKAERFGFCFGV